MMMRRNMANTSIYKHPFYKNLIFKQNNLFESPQKLHSFVPLTLCFVFIQYESFYQRKESQNHEAF